MKEPDSYIKISSVDMEIQFEMYFPIISGITLVSYIATLRAMSDKLMDKLPADAREAVADEMPALIEQARSFLGTPQGN